LTTPRSEDLDTFLDEEVANWKLTNGSRYALDEDWVRRQAVASMERGHNPDGVARQMAAIVQSPDRRPMLAQLDVPSVVIHGDEDPLVTPSGGVATADAIPGAKLVIMEGVGHSIPEGVYDDVISEIERVASLAR
jgi:pimeloyl-ACP methyl ester carboxylesterase